MRNEKELESEALTYLADLKTDKVKPEKFVFEISLYLKSLYSIERNPIALKLSLDFDWIRSIVSRGTS